MLFNPLLGYAADSFAIIRATYIMQRNGNASDKTVWKHTCVITVFILCGVARFRSPGFHNSRGWEEKLDERNRFNTKRWPTAFILWRSWNIVRCHGKQRSHFNPLRDYFICWGFWITLMYSSQHQQWIKVSAIETIYVVYKSFPIYNNARKSQVC